jgi:hypothetical protein
VAIGTNQIYKDASGNVGIGTASPSYKLHVTGGSVFTSLTNSYYCYTSDFGMGTPDSDGLQIFAGATNSIRFGNRISGTYSEHARINSSGNVGIGTASPLARLNAQADNNNSDLGQLIVSGATSSSKRLSLGFNTTSNYGFVQSIIAGDNYYPLVLQPTAGSLLVGTTTALGNPKFCVNYSNGVTNGIVVNVDGTASSQAVVFQNGNGFIGNIIMSGSSTAYNTSSDYRLKENVAPMTGALTKVAQLKPVTYTWKTDGSAGQGFIAHELQAVVPDAVTGEKDALNKDGKPQYQGVDTSFLVGVLTAAIQEQQALIQNLTTRLTALEGN